MHGQETIHAGGYRARDQQSARPAIRQVSTESSPDESHTGCKRRQHSIGGPFISSHGILTAVPSPVLVTNRNKLAAQVTFNIGGKDILHEQGTSGLMAPDYV